MEHDQYDDEISLVELWRIARSGFLFVAFVTVFSSLVTLFLVRHAPNVFEASTTLLASQPDSTLQAFNVSLVTAPNVDVSAYEAAARSTPVLTEALKAASLAASRSDVAAVRDNLSVSGSQDRNSSLIYVSVRNQKPQVAASLANAVSGALLMWDKKRATSHLQTIIDTLRTQIRALDQEIATQTSGTTAGTSDVSGLKQLRAKQTLELNSAEALKTSAIGRLEIVQPAQQPLKPVEPRPVMAAAIAGVLAFFVSYLLVFIRAAFDSRYRSVEELARDLELNVLGEFPTLRSGAITPPRERVNFLRTNLTFALASAHPKVLLISSADGGEGKTTLALGLALAYARNGFKTLLVDADLRKPDVSRMLNVTPEGASDLATALCNPAMAPVPVSVITDDTEFDVLPTNVAVDRATELLSQGIRAVLSRLDDYAVVVIDSAPIVRVADSLVIAPHVSGVILVSTIVDAERRRTRSATDLLKRLGVNVLGVAVTRIPDRQDRRRGSGKGYGYGYNETAEGQTSVHPSANPSQSPVVSARPAMHHPTSAGRHS